MGGTDGDPCAAASRHRHGNGARDGAGSGGPDDGGRDGGRDRRAAVRVVPRVAPPAESTAAVVSGLTAGVPGLELAPETRFLPRLVMRGGEGALINVAGRTAETGVEEHRLPTLGELFPAAAGGFLFGAGAGVGEHGVIQYRGRGRAAAPETPAVGEDLGAPPPAPLGAPPASPRGSR